MRFFNSNIVIDWLNGIPQAAAELAQYKQVYISSITWLEVQVEAPLGLEDASQQAINANFKRIELDEATLLESQNLRRSHRLKLPNAMIWASALTHGWQLVTRNTKDFSPERAGMRLPYTL